MDDAWRRDFLVGGPAFDPACAASLEGADFVSEVPLLLDFCAVSDSDDFASLVCSDDSTAASDFEDDAKRRDFRADDTIAGEASFGPFAAIDTDETSMAFGTVA